jgi:hypothetical protein
MDVHMQQVQNSDTTMDWGIDILFPDIIYNDLESTLNTYSDMNTYTDTEMLNMEINTTYIQYQQNTYTDMKVLQNTYSDMEVNTYIQYQQNTHTKKKIYTKRHSSQNKNTKKKIYTKRHSSQKTSADLKNYDRGRPDTRKTDILPDTDLSSITDIYNCVMKGVSDCLTLLSVPLD